MLFILLRAGIGMNQEYEQLKLKNQLCFPLYAASRKVVNAYTPILKEYSLTYTQYLVMLVLWEKDGITVGDLCEHLYLDNGTLTQVVKKLIAAGYVSKVRGKEDERMVLLYLTENGKKLRESMVDVPGKVGACFSLNPEDAAGLYRILYTLLEV